MLHGSFEDGTWFSRSRTKQSILKNSRDNKGGYYEAHRSSWIMTPTQFSDLTREVICGCLDNSDPLNSGGKNCIGKSEPHRPTGKFK